MTEYEKMRACLIYDCFDAEVDRAEKDSRRLCEAYNRLGVDDEIKKEELMRTMFPNDDFGNYRTMLSPIYIDLFKEMKIGKNFYANHHFTYITAGTVTIGDNVFIGPYCTLAAGLHSLIPKERRVKKDENGDMHDFEYGKPITIGNDVWIAANVTICGGVTIGNGSVIGAGSVVTHDIPEGVIAAGNPCKVIRKITPQDSIYIKSKRN